MNLEKRLKQLVKTTKKQTNKETKGKGYTSKIEIRTGK